MPLRKIIFPVAGLGTRFLPATKASPKEMLTIVNKPLIQYGVEEALAAGLDQVVMVTGKGKRAIEDHFDVSDNLEKALLQDGKEKLYEEISHLSRMANISYVRQKQALGLGHAVACAAHWVGNKCFAVALADELIISEVPAMQQLRAVHEQTGVSVIGLRHMPTEEISNYGVVDIVDENGLLRLKHMVEKPPPDEAPSNLASIGRYIFTPRLMELLQDAKPSIGGEIQLTDAIATLAREEPVYGVVIEGERFDAGNPLGFLMANMALGLDHPDYGSPLLDFIRQRL